MAINLRQRLTPSNAHKLGVVLFNLGKYGVTHIINTELNINEIFYSLQGEAREVGLPTVFGILVYEILGL
jgi:hypothetical protein